MIEGTALRVDPDYAIVKETFPYLSRRLLTDDQPRARAALRQLLYGVIAFCNLGMMSEYEPSAEVALRYSRLIGSFCHERQLLL